MKDYTKDKAFVREFYEAAIKIGQRKMAEIDAMMKDIKVVVETGPRIATGGGFPGFFFWDTVFCSMWARYTPKGLFPIASSFDNLYKASEKTGFIGREFTPEGEPMWGEFHPIAFAPPILSWGELETYKAGITDKERIKKILPRLIKHHKLCSERFRLANGLYFGDGLGCGMDDLSRWPIGMTPDERAEGGIPLTINEMTCDRAINCWNSWLGACCKNYSWNRQSGWIDMTSQMAFDALNIAALCDIVEDSATAAEFRKEHAEIADAINKYCWSEEDGWYFDTYKEGHIKRFHIASVWVLIAEVAPMDRAKRVIEKLKDPEYFNRPIPVPALAKVDPEYDPENLYWRGPVWPCTNYMAIHGLKKYGEEEFAEDIARRYYNACAQLFEVTGTIWENISSEQSDHIKPWSGKDFCGWGSLAPIALATEYNWL